MESKAAGALRRLGANLVAWIEHKNLALDLAQYLVQCADTGKFAPREAMMDYIAALYWAGRPGIPSEADVKAVVAAKDARKIKMGKADLIPLLLEGEIPADWPQDLLPGAPQAPEKDLAQESAKPDGGATLCSSSPAGPPQAETSAEAGKQEPCASGTEATQGTAPAPRQILLSQKRAAQIEKIRSRQGAIGGPGAVAVLQLWPFSGPLEEYLDQTEDPETIWGWQQKNANLERMEDGLRLEPAIAGWWAEQHPDWEITGDGNTRYIHLTEKWAAASPDRIVFDPQGIPHLLQIKSSESWPWPVVPDYYVAQEHWEHLVISSHMRNLSAKVFLAVRFRGGSYREYSILIDPKRVEEMLKQVSVWWQAHIVAKKAPSVQGSRDPDGSIARLYHEGELGHLDVGKMENGARALKLVQDLVKWKSRKELSEKTEAAIRGQLGEIIRDHRGIVTPEYQVTWFAVAGRTKVDWEEVARKAGAKQELIEACTSQGMASRQWRVSERKTTNGEGKTNGN